MKILRNSFTLLILFSLCNSLQAQTNFVIALSKWSGKLRIFSVDDNAKRLVMTDERYWEHGWTDVDVFNLIMKRNQKEEERHYVASARYEMGGVKINQINSRGKIINRTWDNFDLKYNHVEMLYSDGTNPLIFMARNAKKGKHGYFQINRLDGRTGTPGKQLSQGEWGVFTHVEYYSVGKKHFLFAYHIRSGAYVRYQIEKSGKLKKIKEGNWEKEWSSFTFYQAEGKTFVVSMKKGTANYRIRVIKPDGSFGNDLLNKNSKFLSGTKTQPGWTIIEPFKTKKGNKEKLFFFNQRNGVSYTKEIKTANQKGKLGASLNKRLWNKEWSAIDFYQIKKTRKDLEKRDCCPRTPTRLPDPEASKSAALMIFYTDDKPSWQFAQRVAIQEEQVTKNYPKTILLTNKKTIKSLVKPSIKGKPTSENFFKYLKQLARDGYFIDIYMIGHGGRYGFVAKDKTITSKNIINELGTVYGKKKFPIRMVYQNNCWGSHLNQAFLDVGAKSVLGSRYVNFYCYKFTPFIKNWNAGKTFSESIRKANDGSLNSVIRREVIRQKDITTKKKGYGEKEYYRRKWNMQYSEYDEQKYYDSDAHPITWNSHIVVRGNKDLKKSSKPTW